MMPKALHQLVKALSRRSHSYIFMRVPFNRAMPFVVLMMFVPFFAAAVHQSGFSKDVAVVVLTAAGFFCVLAYLSFFRFRDLVSIRVYVTRFGIVYHERHRTLRSPKRLIVSLRRSGKPWNGMTVSTLRGDFEFDYRIVNGLVLQRQIESWLRER